MMWNWLASRKNARLRRIPAITYPRPTITAVSPDPLLLAGGSVTITGTDFSVPDGSGGTLGNVDSVLFNGTALTSLAIVSATSLSAIYGAQSIGTVHVWVRSSTGGDAYKASSAA